jgi:hypothetical protein
MIDQLPDALTQAASWSEYRKVLHRLRDASGITMRGLHPAALEQGFTDAPKTFTRVVAADDTKPDKRQVEILVQVCTAYAREVKRREALRLFMEAYQRLETAAAAPPASPEFTGPSAEQTAPSLPIEAAVSAPTTPAVTGSPVSAEEAAVVLTEPPDERSWWRKRSRTQKVLFTASALATVASTVFGVVHRHAELLQAAAQLPGEPVPRTVDAQPVRQQVVGRWRHGQQLRCRFGFRGFAVGLRIVVGRFGRGFRRHRGQ